MADKVLGQISFIETDDGFRVEIKGDKERIRKMGFPPDAEAWREMGFDPEQWTKGFRRRHGWRHGPWGRRHFGSFGPWMWGWCWGDDEPEDEAYEKSPGDTA